VSKSQRAKFQLQRLGLFNDIDIHIDIGRGDEARSDGYEVTFRVHEKRRVTGEIGTMVGTNEGSLVGFIILPTSVL
jgi:outer membrane protein assembly factor BamA